MTTIPAKADLFKGLTPAALEAWTDKAIASRGRQYFRSGWVSNLAVTSSGAVVARVRGNRRYTTWVDFSGDRLESGCTCPYDLTCKHAVAVALAYQDRLKRGQEVPPLTGADPRQEARGTAGFSAEDGAEEAGPHGEEAAGAVHPVVDDGPEDVTRSSAPPEPVAAPRFVWRQGKEGLSRLRGLRVTDQQEAPQAPRRAPAPAPVAAQPAQAPMHAAAQTAHRPRRPPRASPEGRQTATPGADLTLPSPGPSPGPPSPKSGLEEGGAAAQGLSQPWPAGQPSIGRTLDLREAALRDMQAFRDRGTSGEKGYNLPALRTVLEELAASGRVGEVLDLCKELLRIGNTTAVGLNDVAAAKEVASCVGLAFQALARSGLPVDQQVSWAIEAETGDVQALCTGAGAFWDAERSLEERSAIADRLSQLLDQRRAQNITERIAYDHRRAKLFRRTLAALLKAGREAAIFPLCQRESIEHGAYHHVVDILVDAGRGEDAETWARKGARALREKDPETAGRLLAFVLQRREEAGDLRGLAAVAADDFLRGPTLGSYQALEQASRRAGCWEGVRAGALRYLETGLLPFEAGPPAPSVPWPLPDTGLRDGVNQREFPPPMTGPLLDIALAEKRPDDVLRWYDVRRQAARWAFREEVPHAEVAEAVEQTHPDRAMAIWGEMAERCAAYGDPQAYGMAAKYLQRVRRVMEDTGRDREWKEYLFRFRMAYSRKSLLMKKLKVFDR